MQTPICQIQKAKDAVTGINCLIHFFPTQFDCLK